MKLFRLMAPLLLVLGEGCSTPEPPPPPSPAAEPLPPAASLEAAREAGAVLLRQERSGGGSFAELYDAQTGAWVGDSEDNHLLQARLCRSFHRLFRATGEERFSHAGDRCLGLLLGRAQGPRPEHAGEDFAVMTDGAGEGQGDLGATALALLARIERAEATDRREDLEGMRRMGRFLLFQQTEAGSPVFHYPLTSPRAEARQGTEGSAWKDLYAPSQAALALVRFSRLDGENEELWRQGGERFAGWVMGVRDLGKTYDQLLQDPWLLEALAELYEASGGGRTYYLHGRRIAAGVLRAEVEAGRPVGEYPDGVGSFSLSARVLPTARRAEALAAMVRLAAAADEDPEPYLESLQRAAAFLRQALLGDEALAGDLATGTVLHAVEAWLGLWEGTEGGA